MERPKRCFNPEPYGLLASSQAMRLKPHAIDVRVSVNPSHWFLGDRSDTRSSYYLEDAATEFQVQGLEVDWACATWDADLRRNGSTWSGHSFSGDSWKRIHKPDRQRYLLNAYRVLLTRARQGMAIFVPRGSEADPTRPPGECDAMFSYLSELGLTAIQVAFERHRFAAASFRSAQTRRWQLVRGPGQEPVGYSSRNDPWRSAA